MKSGATSPPRWRADSDTSKRRKKNNMALTRVHRMLSRRGNPTSRNLFAVMKVICESLAFKPRVAVGANS